MSGRPPWKSICCVDKVDLKKLLKYGAIKMINMLLPGWETLPNAFSCPQYHLKQSFQPSYGFGSHPSSPDLQRTGHSVPRDTLNIPFENLHFVVLSSHISNLYRRRVSVREQFKVTMLNFWSSKLKFSMKSSRHLTDLTDFSRKTTDFSDFSLISTTFAGDCMGEAICFRTRPISAEWPGGHQTRRRLNVYRRSLRTWYCKPCSITTSVYKLNADRSKNMLYIYIKSYVTYLMWIDIW